MTKNKNLLAPYSATSAPRGWSQAVSLPPLGNLEAYISAVNSMPMLTPEQEQDYAKRLVQDNDLEAAGRLVMSHLRLVVSVARQYLGYGLSHGDLIQEGNIGLMKAVKRFDPNQGVRLVSYAIHWIKAEIHEFILKNWRMVKVATTKAQRKLFFNLRSKKQSMRSTEMMGSDESITTRDTLSEKEIDTIAQDLDVKREEVLEMQTRMLGGDVVLDPAPSENGEQSFGPIGYLSDIRHEPTEIIESKQRNELATEGVAAALETLDDRSRRIVQERWLNVDDNGSGGMTLHELAAEFDVSAERIRQIEAAAMKKMRIALLQYA